MAGAHWTFEEKKFVLSLNEKGLHPKDIMKEHNKNKKFPPRTIEGINKFLNKNGISYMGRVPVEKKRLLEKEEKLPVKRRVERDRTIQDLKDKLKLLSDKYTAITRELSLEERLVNTIKEEVKALPSVELKWVPDKQRVKTEETAVLLLSDLHTGEIVDREAMIGLGEYDFLIMNKRLRYLAHAVHNLRVNYLNNQEIPRLIIFCLGDMVSGLIHQELIENSEDVIFQTLNGSFVTAQMILELSQVFPEVEVYGVVGNHGRLTKKKPSKRPHVNWDYVFYQFMGTFLAVNNRIKCSFPKSFFLTKKIYNWLFLNLHGDNIRSWAGVPWYGIQRKTAQLREVVGRKDQILNYVNLGHFHNTGELDQVNGEILLNGSVIGGTEYAFSKLFTYDRPTQLFYGVHPTKGVTWRYPIRLDFIDKEVKPYLYNKELSGHAYMKQLIEEMKG